MRYRTPRLLCEGQRERYAWARNYFRMSHGLEWERITLEEQEARKVTARVMRLSRQSNTRFVLVFVTSLNETEDIPTPEPLPLRVGAV